MSKKDYILKRALQAPLIVFSIILLNFFLIKLAPGDPVEIFVSDAMAPREYVEAMRHSLGLDLPIHEQFIIYVNRLIHGDFGFSFTSGVPVLQLLSSRLINTLLLTGTAFVFSVGLGILLGVMASKRAYSKLDNSISFSSLVIYSMPQFWIAIIFLIVLVLYVPLFPAGGLMSIGKTGIDYWLDIGWHLVLPALVLGLTELATFVRLTRASMLEQLGKDYILTAKSKGCSEKTVMYKHAFRNALMPTVTMLGLRLPWLIYGAVLIETVFSWPGLGKLMYDSIFTRDFNMIMGVFVIISILIVLFNLITDIVYTYVDPRISY